MFKRNNSPPILRALKAIALAAMLAVSGLMATSATAQTQVQQPFPRCGPWEALTRHLDKQYKEKRSAFGAIGQKSILEVYASEKGAWTIIITDRNGRACVMAAGHSWETMKIKPGEGV